MRKHNPFTPGSGEKPPYLAGRESEQNKLTDALSRTIDLGTGKTIVMYGPRGTGKTVLLNWFEAECSKADAVAIKTTPSRILPSLDALPELLLPENKHRPDKLQAGVGRVKPERDMRTSQSQRKLEQALIEECKSKPRILLLDEAHTLDPETCQGLLTLAQEVAAKAPFLLVLAGTPGLKPFLMSVGATFVERSEMLGIGNLSEQAAADALSRPLQEDDIAIRDDALNWVVEDAQRYPYVLQLWGRELWAEARKNNLSELTSERVSHVVPEIESIRQAFYGDRYHSASLKHIRPAMEAIAEAYNGGSLTEKQVLALIAPIVGGEVTGAEDLLFKLETEGYVWKPPRTLEYVPGIPSFITFIQRQLDAQRGEEHELSRIDG